MSMKNAFLHMLNCGRITSAIARWMASSKVLHFFAQQRTLRKRLMWVNLWYRNYQIDNMELNQ